MSNNNNKRITIVKKAPTAPAANSRFVWQEGDIVTDECPKCGSDDKPVVSNGKKLCPKCGTPMRSLQE